MILAAILLLTVTVVLAVLSRAHRSPVTAVDDALTALDVQLDRPTAAEKMAA